MDPPSAPPPPPAEQPAPAPTARRRSGWAPWLLIVLAIFLIHGRPSPQRSQDPSGGPTADPSIAILQAEVVTKMLRAQPQMDSPVLRRQLLEPLEKATAAEPKPVEAVRRLIVLRRELRIGEVAAEIDALAKTGLAETPERLQAEQRFWRALYLAEAGPVEPPPGGVDGLALGWFRHLVERDLARRAGDAEAERRANEAAEREARSTTTRVLAAVVVGALAGLAGLVLLVGYVVWRLTSRKTPPRPADPPEVRERKAHLFPWVFLVYIGTMIVLPTLVALVLFGAGTRRETLGIGQQIGLAFALQWGSGLLAIALGLALARRAGLTLADFGWKSRHLGVDLLWGIGGWLASLPLLVLAIAISIQLFGTDSPPNPAGPMLLEARSAGLRLLLGLVAVVGAPLFEEHFFRGALFQGARARFGLAAGVILSSAVFAAVHPQLPLGFLNLFATGAVLAILFHHRESIVPALVMHAINNGAIVLLVLAVTSA